MADANAPKSAVKIEITTETPGKEEIEKVLEAALKALRESDAHTVTAAPGTSKGVVVSRSDGLEAFDLVHRC